MAVGDGWAFLEGLQFWHWMILGLGLAVVEVMAPGTFFLWLGIAAGLTGVVVLVIPEIAWQLQLILFGVLSVVSVWAGRTWLRRHPLKTEDATLNRRGLQYVGRVFVVDQAIVNGRGTVKVGDSLWRAEGPDAPVGARVRVTGIAGTVLQVETAE
ncbi:MAG: membrane protein [Alphaproteobacteria bacterium]|nr:MAG: membrane protein [Alphaproteobacteria bacterium]